MTKEIIEIIIEQLKETNPAAIDRIEVGYKKGFVVPSLIRKGEMYHI